MIIRPYQPKDKKNLVQVCYDTGYLGNSAVGHFSDVKLFGLLFCEYYLDYESYNCYVADDNGEAVGYIIGTTDSKKQNEIFNKKMVPRILARMLTYTFWFHNKDGLWVLKEALKNHDNREMEKIYKEYPAHLHVDIWEKYQRRGLGVKMMDTYLQHMKNQGVQGIHLGTTSKNQAAIPFYKKYGFEIVLVQKNRFWNDDDLLSYTFAMKL